MGKLKEWAVLLLSTILLLAIVVVVSIVWGLLQAYEWLRGSNNNLVGELGL
jgi:hypothetical protein